MTFTLHKKKNRLGGNASHERLMLANLASSLFINKYIKTTYRRAKGVQPYAEKLITLSKKNHLAARRQVLKFINNKNVVNELFTTIFQKVKTRNGGYTRITKIGHRKGDNAKLAVIELVDFENKV